MERHTKSSIPAVATDPTEIAKIEARNGLRQFDAAMAWVDRVVNSGEPFQLNIVQLCALNKLATDGVSPTAGMLRNCEVVIHGSGHKPPDCRIAPGHAQAMCDYVNASWASVTPIHLAAYLLWQVNWIHPFQDGNGRTARMISYVVLCIRLGFRLPGVVTIPEQIARDKQPYYNALEAADAAHADGRLDVSVLEDHLSALLAKQLLGIHHEATGTQAQDRTTTTL